MASAQKITNPKTGRSITVGGPTYKKLVKEGVISDSSSSYGFSAPSRVTFPGHSISSFGRGNVRRTVSPTRVGVFRPSSPVGARSRARSPVRVIPPHVRLPSGRTLSPQRAKPGNPHGDHGYQVVENPGKYIKRVYSPKQEKPKYKGSPPGQIPKVESPHKFEDRLKSLEREDEKLACQACQKHYVSQGFPVYTKKQAQYLSKVAAACAKCSNGCTEREKVTGIKTKDCEQKRNVTQRLERNRESIYRELQGDQRRVDQMIIQFQRFPNAPRHKPARK